MQTVQSQLSKNSRNYIKDDRGSVLIVEASIVFPVVLLVLAFLLMVGNAYYQKSRVESIVTEVTYAGAAYCAEPLLPLAESGSDFAFSSSADDRSKPYRYFSGMDYVELELKSQLDAKFNKLGTGLFAGMGMQSETVNVKYDSAIVYATLSTDVKYGITVPVKLLGMDDFVSIPMSAHVEVAVSDVPEFIRNINTVVYYFEISGLKEKVDDVLKFLKVG